jgi:predicted transcriptional regulator
MEVLWNQGASSIREIWQSLPRKARPAYPTVQATVYRLEAKKALRVVKKISHANIVEGVVTRNAAQTRLVDEFLAIFGGRMQPFMAHLIESGRFTHEDFEEAEKYFDEFLKREKNP